MSYMSKNLWRCAFVVLTSIKGCLRVEVCMCVSKKFSGKLEQSVNLTAVSLSLSLCLCACVCVFFFASLCLCVVPTTQTHTCMSKHVEWITAVRFPSCAFSEGERIKLMQNIMA